MTLNRERLALLTDIRDGRVHVSATSGFLFRRVRGGQNRRVDRTVRELRAAELVHADLLELTAAGERALELAGGGR